MKVMLSNKGSMADGHMQCSSEMFSFLFSEVHFSDTELSLIPKGDSVVYNLLILVPAIKQCSAGIQGTVPGTNEPS